MLRIQLFSCKKFTVQNDFSNKIGGGGKKLLPGKKTSMGLLTDDGEVNSARINYKLFE